MIPENRERLAKINGGGVRAAMATSKGVFPEGGREGGRKAEEEHRSNQGLTTQGPQLHPEGGWESLRGSERGQTCAA